MSAVILALTLAAAIGAAICASDARKAAERARADRFRAEDAANRAQYEREMAGRLANATTVRWVD